MNIVEATSDIRLINQAQKFNGVGIFCNFDTLY